MYYTFQESYIWEGANNDPDRDGATVQVRAKNVAEASKKADRKKRPGLGRHWVLIETKETN